MAPPTPTQIAGQIATNDVLSAQLKVDMDTSVFAYDPPGNPYTRIVTKRLKSKPAKQTTVRWMEDDRRPIWDTLTATVNDTATTLAVTNGAMWQSGDLGKVPSTGEVVRVTNRSGNNLTVVRGYMGTAATITYTTDYLLNLRTAQMEGDLAPEAIATQKVEKYNYTEIIKTPVHITNTNDAVQHYNGDEFAYQLRKAGEEHGVAWEQVAIHGRKKEDTSTAANPIRAAGGIDEHISTNVLAAGGVLTESEFRSWLGDCFRFRVSSSGNSAKILLAGRPLINTINSWGLNKLQMNETARQTYGMDIRTYEAGFGRVEVIYHPELEYGYSGYGYLVDPDGAIYRPLRSTKLEMNIQANGEDAKKHQYITEASFQFALEKTFGLVTGVTF